jgi:hypothetical protein
MSRLAEFDTNKALYELFTRDLIEELRGKKAQAVVDLAAPVDESEVAETPVPLPLVAILAIVAILSLVTSFKNPLNQFTPFRRQLSAIGEARKAISLQRMEAIAQGIEKYNVVNGRLPERLQDLAPLYVSESMLSDPWGNAYKYLPRPDRYLVIGFSPNGKVDTDLMVSRAIDIGTAPSPTTPTGGKLQLID